MKRRDFFQRLLPVPMVWRRALGAASGERPNVLILLADDLGWADVGFHQSEIRTPNLDRLAREGTRLERFYSFPVCSPTRSALLTGRSPMRLGLGYTVIRPWSEYGLPVEEQTLARSFAAAGYGTAMTGKWHLGHAYRKYLPNSRGFQHSYGHFNGAIDYYTHIRDGGLDWHRNGKPLEQEGYSTDLIAAEAVERIRKRDRSKPVLLYVPFNAPHGPLQAPESLIDRYANIADQRRRVFAAMVDSLDAGIGRILSALEEEGIAKNTLVLFFSDNGGPTNLGARNTPLRGAKGTTFEGGIRVPAVMRWPGSIPAGSLLQQVTTVMDVFPTLAAAAGVEPANKLPLDGRNLWPVIQGRARPFQREDLFFSVEVEAGFYLGVHSGPWKLVQRIVSSAGDETNMLFQIEKDPNETTDLSAEHPAVVKDLAARIERWRQLHPAGGERHSARAKPGWKAPAKWADAVRP